VHNDDGGVPVAEAVAPAMAPLLIELESSAARGHGASLLRLRQALRVVRAAVMGGGGNGGADGGANSSDGWLDAGLLRALMVEEGPEQPQPQHPQRGRPRMTEAEADAMVEAAVACGGGGGGWLLGGAEGQWVQEQQNQQQQRTRQRRVWIDSYAALLARV
jgi:hypothetical protein